VYLGLWVITNAVSAWFLLWPLTREERKRQWLKYTVLGKLNYSLAFLDIEQDRIEWEQYKKGKKEAPGHEQPAAAGHH